METALLVNKLCSVYSDIACIAKNGKLDSTMLSTQAITEHLGVGVGVGGGEGNWDKGKVRSTLFRQGSPISTWLVSKGALRKLRLQLNFYI